VKLQTKYFGLIDYEADEVLRFPLGLFGFAEEQQFLLLPFEGSAGTLLCLQSVQTPALAFVAMDPFALCPDYKPRLQPAELEALEAEDYRKLCFYVLCAVRDPVSNSTVNLKCPVVINPGLGLARQVILEGEEYEMRHPLAEFRRKEMAESC